MIEIGVNNVSKSFGFGSVFENINFEIKTGEVISLVGENGCGKSTLLNIINGVEDATSGNVFKRKDLKIGYLKQNDDIDDIVRNILYSSFENVLKISNKLKSLENKMLSSSGDELEIIINKYSKLQEDFIRLDGYEINSKVEKIANDFGITSLLDYNYYKLSGGEKRLVSLAKIILTNPDVLILDEPTNHLDMKTLSWLEEYIKSFKGAVLIVSHDRYFLDKVSTKTILLEEDGVDIYHGNYSYYKNEYKLRFERKYKDYELQAKEIARLKESVKRLREFSRLGNNPIFDRRAKAIESRIEHIEKLSKPKESCIIPLEFKNERKCGDEVIRINELSISFGDKVIFKDLSHTLKRGKHYALIGDNGSGKTTLINNILNGNESIVVGNSVKVGYIPQIINFDTNEDVLHYASHFFNGDETKLRSALFSFLFDKQDIFKKVSKLSGGEMVRLKLFCLIQDNVNLLILDEPTNHLDVNTREILETSLKEYKGTILFVSHDRYFINTVANSILSIENKSLKEYPGNYDDYLDQVI